MNRIKSYTNTDDVALILSDLSIQANLMSADIGNNKRNVFPFPVSHEMYDEIYDYLEKTNCRDWGTVIEGTEISFGWRNIVILEKHSIISIYRYDSCLCMI